MSIQFHETQFGHQFFGSQLPKLIAAINRVADKYVYLCEMVSSPARTKKLDIDERVVLLVTSEEEKVLQAFEHSIKNPAKKIISEDVEKFIKEMSEHHSTSIRVYSTDAKGVVKEDFYYDFVLTVTKIK